MVPGMEPASIRPVSFADLQASANFTALVAEYAHETANSDMGPVELDVAAYTALESAGMLHILGAYQGDDLIGYASVLVNAVPHYRGKRIAVTESIFVAAAHRHTGAGTKLLKAAGDTARGMGAVALVVSAPIGGQLEKVLPRSGFRATNTFFFRGLA
jgi:GNAT superfamily N-acetyltransferase